MKKKTKKQTITADTGSILYQATYKLRKVEYNHIVSTDSEIEWSGVYKADEHILENPPDRSLLIKNIRKLLKGTGIHKITITLFQENL